MIIGPGQPDHNLMPQVGVLADGREVDPVWDGAEPIPHALEAGRILHDLAGARGDVDDGGRRIAELELVERPVGIVLPRYRPLIVVDE
jgi:hypothetical protein